MITKNKKILLCKSAKSGIKIKKANKGKFTDYCGGKVTNECIQKGLNSEDPQVRKRANFARNARKWKHNNGGTFKINQPKRYDLGGFLKSDQGQAALGTGLKAVGAIFNAKNTAKQISKLKEYFETLKSLSKKELFNNNFQTALGDVTYQTAKEKKELSDQGITTNASPAAMAKAAYDQAASQGIKSSGFDDILNMIEQYKDRKLGDSIFDAFGDFDFSKFLKKKPMPIDTKPMEISPKTMSPQTIDTSNAIQQIDFSNWDFATGKKL